MTIINAKTRRDLEYERLKQLLKRYVSASLGEEAIDALAPLADRKKIEHGINEVQEALTFLERKGNFSLSGVRDLAPLLKRAREYTFLEGGEFLHVLETITATRQVREQLLLFEDLQILHRLGERLSPHPELAKNLNHKIDERGNIREDATRRLADLIRKKRVAEREIEQRLRSLIEKNPELISEPVVTQRDGRLVVPIKSGATGDMEFIVHDRSNTGQTLYAEPSSLVSQNNRITELDAAIRDEKGCILRELTTEFTEQGPSFMRDRELLARIDSLFARANYATDNRCSFPGLSDTFSLIEARHPLLPQEEVVPISLSLNRDKRMAIITGPNTGGKTVTLKTLGLLTLMVQSTIPIPASPDSQFAIVDNLRSDIGDEQSLQQNLSTFSGHMKNIVSILQTAAVDSLILLDELGAGTDPQEGAALGLSIIEQLLGRQVWCAVSTHLTPLKHFSILHPQVKACAMEFDAESLSPTFRVIEGLPGRSNAFVIAHRLGLPDSLVNQARDRLSKGEIRADDIISELQRTRGRMIQYTQQAQQRLRQANQLKADYEKRITSFEREKRSELSSEVRELEEFLRHSQNQVEGLLAELKADKSETKAKAAYRQISSLRDRLPLKDTAARSQNDRSPPFKLRVNRRVHVKSVDADGRIEHVYPHGRVAVEIDGRRISTKESDLSPVTGENTHPSPPRPQHPQVDRINLQLNVRGKTVSAALREVEAYLDRLLLANVGRASILHGKGTGALRDSIRDYLSSCSFVKDFGPALPREGGEGVTVFELEE
jgi:DNA mismatch repair protein MutS2